MNRFARLFSRTALAVAFATAAVAGHAQDAASYPNKPVKIIVPFAPGGGSDFMGRLLAKQLTEKLGQPFIVENKPGAGGNLGAEIAVKSPADGYTLMLTAASYTVNPYVYKVPFDSLKDIFGKEISRDLIGRLAVRELIGTGPREPRRGAPYTFVTTDVFLATFGMASLRDLPDPEQLDDSGLAAL